MLESWYETFVLICYVWFFPNVVLLAILAKPLHFGLSGPKDIVLKVLWFIQV